MNILEKINKNKKLMTDFNEYIWENNEPDIKIIAEFAEERSIIWENVDGFNELEYNGLYPKIEILKEYNYIPEPFIFWANHNNEKFLITFEDIKYYL